MGKEIWGDLDVKRALTVARRADEGLNNLGALTGDVIVDKFSYAWQMADPNGADRTFTLPNATTLTIGWQTTFENRFNTTNSLIVKDFDGTTLIEIEPNSAAQLTLVTNATQAGGWYVLDLNRQAFDIPFYDSRFTADNVYSAIIEVYNSVLTSASPGFSFGRSGVIPAGSYLANETVPSNIAGRYVYITNAVIQKVFIANELLGDYKFRVYKHDGNEINITSLGFVDVTASRGGSFEVEWSVEQGKQLAFRIDAASTNNPKNVVAGLELTGTRT